MTEKELKYIFLEHVMGNLRIFSYFLMTFAFLVSVNVSGHISSDSPTSSLTTTIANHNNGHFRIPRSGSLCKLNAIEKLRITKSNILKAHRNYSIARTIGSVMSISGGIVSLMGILLVGSASATSQPSIVLTSMGLAFHVLGAAVTVTTNMIETVKSESRWTGEIEAILRECDIPPRLVEDNHSNWMHYSMLPIQEAPYILLKGQTAITIGKILRLMVSVASAKDFTQMEALTAQVPVQNKYFYASVLPGTFIWNSNHWLTNALTKMGMNTAKVGVTSLQVVSVGIGVGGIGMDIYTIIETWTRLPDLARNVDKIMDYLELDSSNGIVTPTGDIMVTIYRESHDVGEGEYSVIHILEDQCLSLSGSGNGSDSWNNAVTRFTLHGNKCVRVWAEVDCRGNSSCFCESQHDLFGRWITPNKNWNDEISSFSGCSYGGDIAAIVMLYEYVNFTGSQREIQIRDGECLSFFHADGWNDRVSSLNVTRGCVEYFNDALCKGEKQIAIGAQVHVGKYNDKISSFRPCQQQ